MKDEDILARDKAKAYADLNVGKSRRRYRAWTCAYNGFLAGYLSSQRIRIAKLRVTVEAKAHGKGS